MSSEHRKNLIDAIIKWMLVILMLLMVVNVSWQVISRYLVGVPSSFTDELSRFMLIWLGMLGAAYVAGQDKHLAIDILPQKLNGLAKIRLQLFIQLVVMVFALVVMVFGGANLVYITHVLGQKSATLQVPLAYVYTILPFSGILISYYQTERIIALVKHL